MWRRTRSSDAGRKALGGRRIAKRRFRAQWVGWGLVLCAPFACGGLLGIESPRRVSADAGRAGQGEAGDAAGGALGGSGGSSGPTGTGGGGGTSGAPTGGVAGDPGGTSGSSGGSGERGGTGSEPPGLGPTLGEECSEPDFVSCTNDNRNIVLRCESGTWVHHDTCAQNHRCKSQDLSNQRCAPIDQNCALHGTFCQSDGTLVDCDTDPFNPMLRPCAFGCEAGRCLPGAPNELIVHEEPLVGSPNPAWRGPIPVCFLGDDQGEKEWTRDELARSWGRYLDVSFTGFGPCEAEDVPDVAIEFLADCRGRLGNTFLPGDPDMRLRVGICTSYFGAEGGSKAVDVDEALFRFLVRHQFGHVLGLRDQDSVRADSTMVRGLAWPQTAPSISAADLGPLLVLYGRKPSGSFVTNRGKCLTADGNELKQDECSENSGRFGLETGQLKSSAGGAADCVVADLAGAVTLGTCYDPATALRFERARWGTVSACAAGREYMGLGVVALAPCNWSSHPLEWSLDVRSSDAGKVTARIRADSHCLTLPLDVVRGQAPLLVPCNDAVVGDGHLFDLWQDGRITYEPSGNVTGTPLALCWEADVLRLGTCDQVHWFSGTLEVPYQHLLCAAPGQTSRLSACPPQKSNVPLADEIFDFIP